MGILSSLFGGGRSEKVAEFLENGAVIIDVRSPGEFQSGHNKGSKNIPLQNISGSIAKIKAMKKPIVVCCASGMRSGQAKSILEREGIEVVNAGGWTALQN